jgi:hypothetical protein
MLGIALCSMGVLMQEVLLTRIFSFTIWYHLAYLTISTALLGFGAAGSVLARFPHLYAVAPGRLAARCCAGAALALLIGLTITGPNPISPDDMIDAPLRFSIWLLGYYVAVTAPFLFAGIAIATPLSAYPAHANRLYAADLLGAGIGCLAAVAALQWLDGAAAASVCAGVFLFAGAVYAGTSRLPGDGSARLRTTCALGSLACVLAAPVADRVIHFVPTDTKTMGRPTERGIKILHSQWSPVNRVDLYTKPGRIGGFWTAYGRSQKNEASVPHAHSIVYDAHNGSDVYRVRGRESLGFLDHHLLAAPYSLTDRPDVLVIGVGGGIDILNAIYHGAKSVTGVELQPITVGLHHGVLAPWTGGWFQRPEVKLVAAEGRHYVRSHSDRYDLLQITAVDTFAAQTTGAYVLAESYLYSVEALGDYLDRLTDDGILSIGIGDLMYRDPTIPTPYSARLALIAREALRRAGVTDPGAHLMLTGQGIPNFNAPPEDVVVGAWIQNLMVKKKPFSTAEIASIRGFIEEGGFSVRVAPDDGEADPHLSRILHAKDADLDRIVSEQVFEIDAITDDRPFFFHVLPWEQIFLDRRVEWSHPGSGTGQIVLVMMLVQALVLGAILILVPLWGGERVTLPRRTTGSFLIYFLSLGLGFMLIEISFVQKYVLFLGYPTYSLSVTIFSLLVFAAIGAALSRRIWHRARWALLALLGATLGLLTIDVAALPWIRDALLSEPLPLRIAITLAMQCPLGIALGMYFPTGLELIRQRDPRLIPWAWAVNGVASVAASVLAVLLGMSIGFSGVAAIAGVIYIIGTLALLDALRSDGSAGVNA